MRVAAAARRRLVLRRLVALLGPALLSGAAAALLAVAATRIWPQLGSWVFWLAGPILAAAVVAIVAGLARRPALLVAAGSVDHAMRLRDRLTNGVALARTSDAGAEAGPFTRLALQEADHAAAQANVRRALPIRLGGAWGWAPALILAAAAIGFFVPQRTPAAPGVVAAQEKREEARERTAAAIQQAIDEAQEDVDPEHLDLATRERLDALEELERQLLDGRLEPGEAMDQALRTLDEAAEQEQEEARQALAAQEAMRDRLARSRDPSEEAEAASPLAEALRNGDLEQARREAESLLNRRDDIAPEEADRLADDLRRLAEALRPDTPPPPVDQPTQEPRADEQPSGETPPQPAAPDPSAQEPPPAQQDPADQPQSEPPSPLERALQDQGVPPEQARELAEQADPEQVREALEEHGVDPDVAEELAEQTQQRRREEQGRRQAEQEAQRLSEALEQAADSLQQRPPSQPEQREPQPSQQQQQQQQREPGAEQQPGEQQQPGTPDQQQQQTPGQQETPDQGQPQQQEQPGQSGEQQPSQTDQGDPQQQPSQQPGEQPGQEQQTERGAAEQGEAQRPTPEPGQQPGQQQQQQQQAPTPGQQQGVQPQQQPGQGQQQQTDGLRRLVEELQRQQQAGDSSDQSQRNADRLREQARRMLDSASPEERERLQRWAEQAARDGGKGREAGDGPRPPLGADPAPPGEFDEDVVDARSGEQAAPDGDPRRDQVIAEWYADRPAEGEITSTGAAGAISRARRAAERDMGDRTIHPRYHDLLREYFRRLPEGGAAGGSTEGPAAGGSAGQGK